MLIKFESKRAAPFVMQGEIAVQLISMAGLGRKEEGSISGEALSQALTNLDDSLARQLQAIKEPADEEDDSEQVSLHSRATPLRDMLRHAMRVDSYVMWRPE